MQPYVVCIHIDSYIIYKETCATAAAAAARAPNRDNRRLYIIVVVAVERKGIYIYIGLHTISALMYYVGLFIHWFG